MCGGLEQEFGATAQLSGDAQGGPRSCAAVESEKGRPESDEALVEDLDLFFDRLCGMYWGADSERRSEMRGLMEDHRRLLGNFQNYAGRTAKRLRRTGDPRFLLRGLAAVSMDDDRSCQDYGFVLGQLYLAALTVGVEPSMYFKTAADMSSAEPNGARGPSKLLRAARTSKLLFNPTFL